MTVLWSVDQMKLLLSTVKLPGLTLIDLPQLAWDESLSLARKFVGEVNLNPSDKPPIDFQGAHGALAGSIPHPSEIHEIRQGASGLAVRCIESHEMFFHAFSESKAYQNAHPTG